MLVPPQVFASSTSMGAHAATRIHEGIRTAGRDGRRYLLGCPGGRSAQPVFEALARLVATDHTDLAHVVIVMMDEYLIPRPGGGLRPVSADLPHSCARFGRTQIVGRLDAAAGPGRGIGDDGLWLPDPDDPAAYDEQIADAGGVDLFILASGASDGHVAFNPPGTPADAGTRIVELPDSTRTDNLATFPTFSGLDDVPRHGVTIGVGSIRDLSAETAMVLHGPDKQRAAARLCAAQRYEATWPATIVTDCRRPEILMDTAAAGALAPR